MFELEETRFKGGLFNATANCENKSTGHFILVHVNCVSFESDSLMYLSSVCLGKLHFTVTKRVIDGSFYEKLTKTNQRR